MMAGMPTHFSLQVHPVLVSFPFSFCRIFSPISQGNLPVIDRRHVRFAFVVLSGCLERRLESSRSSCSPFDVPLTPKGAMQSRPRQRNVMWKFAMPIRLSLLPCSLLLPSQLSCNHIVKWESADAMDVSRLEINHFPTPTETDH
jgi:hypothetical protein